MTTYNQKARNIGVRVLALLACAGLSADETMVAGLRCAADTVEDELGAKASLELLKQLEGIEVDTHGAHTACGLSIAAHFVAGRFVPCGAMLGGRRR